MTALLRWASVVVLALLLSWVHDDAAAYGTVSKGSEQYRWTGAGSSAPDSAYAYPSCEAACAASFPGVQHQCSGISLNGTGGGGSCSYKSLVGGVLYDNPPKSMSAKIFPGQCPPNSVDAGGGCVCSKGYRRANQGMAGDSCEPYSCQKGGLSYANAGAGPLPQESAMATRSSCVGPGGPHAGCEMEFTPTSAKCSDATHCWATGTDQTSGDYCDGPTPTSPTPAERPAEPAPPPAPCPTGQCPGSVNGVSGCFPCQQSTNSDGKTTTTKTNDDGTTTTTETGTKTTCDGDQCTTTKTTTTTTRNPDGTITSTGTETGTDEKPQEKFCEENPTSPLCKEGSFGGACAGGFTCQGDAIQCAIAKEQHRRSCELFEFTSPLSDAGEQAMNGQAQPEGHPGANPEQQSVSFQGQLDQANPFGSSCPGDETVGELLGHTLVIPWSRLCTGLQAAGLAAVALSLIAAAMIAFGGNRS